LKADSVEYAGFSAARLLLQSNIKEREAVAVVYADPVEDDEVNFVVLEDGFPLFSRDIFLSGYSEEGGVKVEKLAMVDKMDKLKVEVRVSLDFYLRKFPTRNIKKIIFITPPDFRGELEAFVKERTLSCRFVELGTLVDRPGVFPLGFYKAYAASLAKVVIPKIKVDLLSVTMAPKKALRPKTGHAFTPVPLKFKPKYAIWGALICAAAFGWGVFQRMPVQRDLDMILSMQPRVAAVGLQASLDEVNAKNSEYAEKIRNIDAVVHKRFMLTSELDIIPRIIPEGVWLRDFSFRQDNKNLEFIMTGWAYLKDSNKELEAINMFLTRLKEDKKFGPVFTDISITGVNQGQYRNAPVTSFMIVCKGRR
jgi:Tfp pilus assembly protein PilN